MKQKDLALIVVIIAISGVISLVVTQKIFGTPAKNQEKVEVVQKISGKFPSVNKQYFNKDSVNPTRLIVVDPSNNQNPFSGSNN